ncbi:MAG: thermonuclease family protein [Alphaproteobacteria bacterium]|nr:thermonuclease family protein [Alphaproteobacteria bacterium]
MRSVAALLIGLFALPAFAADIAGEPIVVDGNTIEIDGQRIILHGIDAPESKQVCKADGHSWPCGEHATSALANAIGRTWVECDKKEATKDGRTVAVCRAGGPKGMVLNAHMVAEGMALAYRTVSEEYVTQEDAAKQAKKGLWRGEFTKPWDWRRGVRLASNMPTDKPCQIKGNIGEKGVRIYHMPNGRYYNRTKINRLKGERWFCSEAQAKAAGWRRSKR